MNLGLLLPRVRADFRERSRRYRVLLTRAACVWLGHLVGTGTIRVAQGHDRGVMDSAWIGARMAIVTNTFLSLAGLYIVKNSLIRDQLSRVSRIPATTPMTRFFYTPGKAMSNLVVLRSTAGVIAVGAVLIPALQGGTATVEWWKLFSPFVMTSKRAMACVEALAARHRGHWQAAAGRMHLPFA